MGATGGAVAVMEAAIANAIKASGAIVKIKPEDFQKILAKIDSPLIVRAEKGIFSKKYQYLTAYRGFIFFTKSSYELSFHSDMEMILAEKIWVPD